MSLQIETTMIPKLCSKILLHHQSVLHPAELVLLILLVQQCWLYMQPQSANFTWFHQMIENVACSCRVFVTTVRKLEG